jgi:hypothetical protein
MRIDAQLHFARRANASLKKMPLFKCSAKTHRAHAMHSMRSARASMAPTRVVGAGRPGSGPEKNFRGIVDMPKNRD